MQAQEYCEGGTLKMLIQRAAATGVGKRLYSYGDAARWCSQTARALQYLHEANPQLLHRDLKTENLLLTSTGRAGHIRVMDLAWQSCGLRRRLRVPLRHDELNLCCHWSLNGGAHDAARAAAQARAPFEAEVAKTESTSGCLCPCRNRDCGIREGAGAGHVRHDGLHEQLPLHGAQGLAQRRVQ
jgi:serine/threonine protein kinase